MDPCFEDGVVLFASELDDRIAEGRARQEEDIVTEPDELVCRGEEDVDLASRRVGQECDLHRWLMLSSR